MSWESAIDFGEFACNKATIGLLGKALWEILFYVLILQWVEVTSLKCFQFLDQKSKKSPYMVIYKR